MTCSKHMKSQRQNKNVSSPAMQALFLALLLTAFIWPAQGDVPIHRDEPSGTYLGNWLLCGPFPLQEVDEEKMDTVHLPGFETDFLKEHGGETAPQVKEGQVEKFEGGSATWIFHSQNDPEIDLDDVISDAYPVCAYAYCEVEAPEARAAVLALGTNDGGRVWLNGERIWDHTKSRSLQADSDVVPVVLRKGSNQLLLKIEERGGSWGFSCRLLALDSPDLDMDRLNLFEIVHDQAGQPTVHAFSTREQFQTLIPKAFLKVLLAEEPDVLAWSSDWDGGMDLPIGVDAKDYGEYILDAQLTFVDGHTHAYRVPFHAGVKIEHTLFEKGETDYVIVIGSDASESERWAASELQHWLKAVSGADFGIIDDAEPPSKHEIVVGYNRHLQTLLGSELKPPSDDDESFSYRNAGSNILIWGGRNRGTMYGVIDFLEEEMGCRWYTPRVTVTPQKDFYRFYFLRHKESPGLQVRNVFYFEAFDPQWAARNRSNGLLTFGKVRDQVGGVESYWAVHTFYRFVPPKEFFKDHPEYFSLINGKRVAEEAQLCLTNPNVKRIIKERVLAFMRKHPEHRIYSVSQNDGYGPCQCANCQALVEKEGSESAPILTVVNEVAEAAEKEFPDKYIGTLAYVYSQKPPKTIRPRQNVVIRLCSFDCCWGHDFESCPLNAPFLNDIEQWSKIAPHLYIWDYVVEFSHYIMPFPNCMALQHKIQCFRDHKAIGVMPQAAYQSRGGAFAELKMNLLARLLWNPDCDVDAVIDDFMYGYYGRSGQYVRDYFDMMHERVTPEVHLHHFNPSAPFFTDELIRKADAIFHRAEAVADNEEIRQRVEMARLPILYVKCKRNPVASKQDGTYKLFCDIVEREGITHYSEHGAPDRKEFHDSIEAAE